MDSIHIMLKPGERSRRVTVDWPFVGGHGARSGDQGVPRCWLQGVGPVSRWPSCVSRIHSLHSGPGPGGMVSDFTS